VRRDLVKFHFLPYLLELVEHFYGFNEDILA
jgi:hypothetical protein